ncbi:MAG: methylenetetrahydrofolate reductase [NAD(P)H] [Clostridiales bacterium]|nr:methylenetetrahydrofolate reductase [NAD(P)H] [Clostridiales bacterium]
MKLSELFKEKQVYSFEIFPPKRTAPIDSIYKTLDGLKVLSPDFISVTYGAGGSENFEKTFHVAKAIKACGIESIAHLSCIGLNKEDVDFLLEEYKSAGIDNILALRGDLNPSVKLSKDFKYAEDLVTYIRKRGDFDIAGACYPEGHPEAPSFGEDLKHLKSKVDAGVTHLISQLFFDNEDFYYFLEKARALGIDVPIEAGIMPVVNKSQIERMVSLCGARLPKKFLRIMDKYEDKPEAMRDAGIAYAVDQIVDLLTQGVDGIHLYTMNQPDVASKIHRSIAALLS